MQTHGAGIWIRYQRWEQGREEGSWTLASYRDHLSEACAFVSSLTFRFLDYHFCVGTRLVLPAYLVLGGGWNYLSLDCFLFTSKANLPFPRLGHLALRQISLTFFPLNLLFAFPKEIGKNIYSVSGFPCCTFTARVFKEIGRDKDQCM